MAPNKKKNKDKKPHKKVKKRKPIRAEIRMFSGCEDAQTSADVTDVGKKFKGLPDADGQPGGACTSALLSVLKENKKNISFQKVLEKLRAKLIELDYKQNPQLSASRPLDIKTEFNLVPRHIKGTKRAVMIGINYVGHDPGELSGCHNDVKAMKKYIMKEHDFKRQDIAILMDDGNSTKPTKDNILSAYRKLVKSAQPGDAVFCHFSGHGGQVKDKSGDEEDGFDETLIPLDYKKSGQITDDTLYELLVNGFKKGVYVTFLIDCCHSGSVLDLPFVFTADGKGGDSMIVNQLVALANGDDPQTNFDLPGDPMCCTLL